MKIKYLTAGPSVTEKEIKYVTDAAKNGWNRSWNKYLLKFEKEFARYIGVKYTIATSSCTGAMHIALLALGINKNHEVIVPDLTWIATASVVTYTGAKPVFADVEPDSWCISPDSIEKNITKKTKAIIPVHLYGHSADMTRINKIAKKYNLKVMEDAAPSLGGECCGKKTGSLGDVAAFSFQGAKIMVTGEGGIFATNNKRLYEKAMQLGDQGRSFKKMFWIDQIGYKYKMSNLQAAFGLAQLERIEALVAHKRRIFKWYTKSLKSLDEIYLNAERKDVKNIFWMTSIVLKQNCRTTRNNLIKKLSNDGIDTRPFFYPISSFNMFRTKQNPVCQYLSQNGINLPSGSGLNEKDVDYIASRIKYHISSARK